MILSKILHIPTLCVHCLTESISPEISSTINVNTPFDSIVYYLLVRSHVHFLCR
jgi:hypothetical protein